MEKIKVFSPRSKSAWFYILFGSAAAIFGGVTTVYSLESGFNTSLFGDWIYPINIMQGILFINMGIAILKKERYFVGWDDIKIQYFLPGAKDIETIKISAITGIRLKLHEVKIRVNDTTKVLDLNNVEYKPLLRIKSFFKKLQSATGD